MAYILLSLNSTKLQEATFYRDTASQSDSTPESDYAKWLSEIWIYSSLWSKELSLYHAGNTEYCKWIEQWFQAQPHNVPYFLRYY